LIIRENDSGLVTLVTGLFYYGMDNGVFVHYARM